jgi:DNA-binding beta-propeller fold protein YncE
VTNRLTETLGLLAVVTLVAGCGGNEAPPQASTTTPAATPPAEPAPAGVPTVAPAGTVVPVPNGPEGIVIGTSGVAAIAARDPAAIVLVDAATGAVRRTVPTDGAARHLSLSGPDGPVLVPLETSDELVELSLDDGSVVSRTTDVGRQPHDAVRTADGTIVVTNERGGGVVFVRDGAVVATLPAGPPQPGGAAVVGKYAAVADVQGNGVWIYDGSTRREVAQKRIGTKLTHALGLSDDLAAFADTDGGAVLIERINPEITEVARIEAPGKPYGLAYDAERRRLYVTLTATNQLQVVDLLNPDVPRIIGVVPTVQQPNSVAVDSRSGAVLVTGSSPNGTLQIITPDILPNA